MGRKRMTVVLACIAALFAVVLGIVLLRGGMAPSGDAAPEEPAARTAQDAPAADEQEAPEASEAESGQQAEPATAERELEAPAWDELESGVDYDAQTILVTLAEGVSAQDVVAACGTVAAVQTGEDLLGAGVVLFALEPGATVEAAFDELAASGLVAAAQPDYVYEIMADPAVPSRDELTADALEGEAPAALPAGEEPAGQEESTPSDEAASTVDASAQPEAAADESASQPAEATPAAGDATAAEPSADDLATELAEQAAITVNDPDLDEQWAIEALHFPQAWALVTGDHAVTVAVFDVSFQVDHPDLADNVLTPYNVGTGDSTVDVGAHGTQVLGIIGAVANNELGIAGASHNAYVLPVQVTNSEGKATSSAVIAGYEYVMSHVSERNVRVVNLSLGSATGGANAKDIELAEKIDAAYDAGIVTVAAAGNASASLTPPSPIFPGDHDCVVNVINVDANQQRNTSSNYNQPGEQSKDVSAPGTGIYSTTTNSDYIAGTGTSFAAPHVSAILALEFAANPDLTASQAVQILYDTATDLGSAGFDEEYGYGEVDAYAAVYAAKTGHVPTAASVRYRTHVQKTGWQAWKKDGASAGTTGSALRLEAIEVELADQPVEGSIEYRTHIQGIGWESDWRSDGAMSGTNGQALRLEAIQIRLTGEMAECYDVYYRVHAQHFGWMGWACNGESAGTAGYAYRLEAIQICIVPKGSDAPGSTDGCFRGALVRYRTHVQRYGWQGYVGDGVTSGTSGQSLRLEGIEIRLNDAPCTGSVQYRTHVQRIGWQGWRSDGAMSGTSGQALRLEAIQIRLTGEMAESYDVWYRVHAQHFGWMGWACNGASAGTAGYAYRLEAIEIVVLPKGSAAPGSTDNAFQEK